MLRIGRPARPWDTTLPFPNLAKAGIAGNAAIAPLARPPRKRPPRGPRRASGLQVRRTGSEGDGDRADHAARGGDVGANVGVLELVGVRERLVEVVAVQ